VGEVGGGHGERLYHALQRADRISVEGTIENDAASRAARSAANPSEGRVV